MDYVTWNDRLAANFFRPEHEGNRVFLYVTPDVLAEVAGFQNPVDDFVAAVKAGPPGVTRQGLCQRALQTLENYRDRHEFPPYIAYLSLFVLAAGVEGDFALHAYYPRLRQLLREEPTAGQYPSFHRMLELWDDLERWANEDIAGKLGIFRIDIAGNWIHVGLPIAQTILTERERKVLPQIFARAGLDPTSTPPAEALVRALLKYGPGELQRRTLHLLSTQGERDVYDVLLDIVADELLEWDGHLVEADIRPGGATDRSFAIARLCLAFDSVANRAQCSLRLKINREFPEEGLLLTAPGMRSKITCEEFLDRWSTPLRHDGEGPLNAANFDWLQGLVFRDERLNWQFKLPGGPIRMLTSGSVEGLPGLVEIHALPRSAPFYLLYSSREDDNLLPWLRGDCHGVRQFGNVQGLPAGWQLVFVREALRDSVRQHIPSLSFSSGRRIRFAGGLRTSLGNTFFEFAPPTIVVDGTDGTEKVFCDGQLLTSMTNDGERYQLPRIVTTGRRILVEVKSGDTLVRRSALYLSGDFNWRLPAPLRMFNRWGVPLTVVHNGLIAISGAVISGTLPDVSRFRRPLPFSAQFDRARAPRVFYIGRRAGEIVSWPSEPLPDQWMPVWAVPLGRRGRAIYCGDDPSTAIPEQDDKAPKERRDLWKDVLWHGRKRITPPRGRVLIKLWQRFIETARDA